MYANRVWVCDGYVVAAVYIIHGCMLFFWYFKKCVWWMWWTCICSVCVMYFPKKRGGYGMGDILIMIATHICIYMKDCNMKKYRTGTLFVFVSGQLPTVRTIPHRTCISPDEWFCQFVVVLVGSCPSGELSYSPKVVVPDPGQLVGSRLRSLSFYLVGCFNFKIQWSVSPHVPPPFSFIEPPFIGRSLARGELS